MSIRLALIPARGGSKRFPRKNVAAFRGVPFVAHAINTARDAKLFDRIVVSTEDAEIARIAKDAGAEVHDRDPKLATDTARVPAVCIAVLDEIEREVPVSAFCLLIPPSPFRRPEHVREAYRLLEASRANGVMSLAEWSHMPLWAVHEVQGVVELFHGQQVIRPRSELPRLYRHNGVVIWMRTAAFRTFPDFYGPDIRPYYMSLEDSVDIDHELDLQFAEFLAVRRSQHGA